MHPARPEPISEADSRSIHLRWVAVGVFVFASVINYLDRQILATLAPDLKREFGLTNQDYGYIISAFSIMYAASSPVTGIFLDRVGLNRGISISVVVWSLVGMSTSLVRSFTGLLLVRGALGVAESAGIPSVGKLNGLYLLPKERAIGAALSQIGLSFGLVLAPVFAPYFAAHYGWQWAFFSAGALGLVWVPIWNWTARKIPPVKREVTSKPADLFAMIRDRRFWLIALANFLGMTVYTLWTNWINVYLDLVHHLNPSQAAWFAWAPPLAGSLGALLGGYLSFLWVRKGVEPVESRRRVCLVSGIALLFTAFIPLTPTAGWATLGISLSFFWSACWSANVYTIPVDIYGAERAGFAVSGLVFSYGVTQTLVSPLFGWLIDKYHGFQQVCLLVCALPLVSYFLLRLLDDPSATPPVEDAA